MSPRLTSCTWLGLHHVQLSSWLAFNRYLLHWLECILANFSVKRLRLSRLFAAAVPSHIWIQSLRSRLCHSHGLHLWHRQAFSIVQTICYEICVCQLKSFMTSSSILHYACVVFLGPVQFNCNHDSLIDQVKIAESI